MSTAVWIAGASLVQAPAKDAILTFANVRDGVLIAVAIFTAITASRGLSTWRKQLEGEAEYTLAKRILGLCFEYRDAVERVRDPFMLGHEMTLPEGVEAADLDEKLRDVLGVQNAYTARWERVRNVRAGLYPELIEAEVHWDQELNDRMKVLNALQGKLMVAVEDHLVSVDPRRPDHAKEHLFEPGASKERRALLYRRPDGDDEFSSQFQEGMSEVARYLRTKLRKVI